MVKPVQQNAFTLPPTTRLPHHSFPPSSISTRPLKGHNHSTFTGTVAHRLNVRGCRLTFPLRLDTRCLTDPFSSVPHQQDGNDEGPIGVIRDLPLIALPMTAGNDVLFPGCHQVVKLDEATAQFVSSELANGQSQPQPVVEFAYMALNAWGEPGTVGTIAVVEDMTSPSSVASDESTDDANETNDNSQSLVVFGGVARFRLHAISDDMKRARVEMFNDETPNDEKRAEIEELEQRLVLAMKDIVTLSIKISDDKDHSREKALQETLKRVEQFYTQNDTSQDENAHWMLQLTPSYRRELLSFIVIDMLSVSFMDRRSLLQSTDATYRLNAALKALEPFVRELAAKGAIVGALGKGGGESSSDSEEGSSSPPPPSSPSSS